MAPILTQNQRGNPFRRALRVARAAAKQVTKMVRQQFDRILLSARVHPQSLPLRILTPTFHR